MMRPNKGCTGRHQSVCAGWLHYELQISVKGKWVIVQTLGLGVPVSPRGDVHTSMPVNHNPGDRFRLRAYFLRDEDNAKTVGPWWDFRFTK